MSNWYVLEGKKAVPASVGRAAAWMEENFDSPKRVVGYEETENGSVSTVFLCLDHSFVEGTQMLFETLIFGGTLDGEGERYSTWDEAAAGHALWAKRVKGEVEYSEPAPADGDKEA